MRILPVLISFNEETMEKLSVFKLERIHNTFETAQKRVLEDNILNAGQQDKKVMVTKKLFNATIGIYVQIPESMYEPACQKLWLSLPLIRYQDKQGAGHRLREVSLD